MVATFQWDENNGAAAGTVTTQISNGNWGSADSPNLDVTVEANKIVVGTDSYIKYEMGHFSGSYTLIGPNGKLWLSGGGSPEANTVVTAAATTTYAAPVTTASGDSAIPQSSGAALTITFGAAASTATFTSTTSNAGYTCYYKSQFQSSAGAATGTQGPFTITLQYDES